MIGAITLVEMSSILRLLFSRLVSLQLSLTLEFTKLTTKVVKFKRIFVFKLVYEGLRCSNVKSIIETEKYSQIRLHVFPPRIN